ncbi:SHOCT domain-containing protein [Pseudarthrobacter cellobiosi]|uniref:SHOCT domain-containing protein n=1 Tax=Pseudarthrobacter cellobiosi TaxID=2953654 RepID=UPI00208FF2E1|nr:MULTISPECIES: SHOCT domain-containing protein [unclassified Pseudarthrobacter]MCO4255568.1 SHOCT domain-containing protein [Pseudarthrobacter sp. HLT1-5]MCO4273615.1 SHOCT domain-containing protein [Pseudarthrobacter sp. HLT3-5]
MMWGYGQGMEWMWLWGPLLLIGIALLVLLAVRVAGGGIRRGYGPGGPDGLGGPPPMGGSRARQILDERFAKGELTADQYRDQLKVLGEGR